MNTFTCRLIPAAAWMAAVLSVSAEMITDPALYTEIDPAGAENIDRAFGNTTEAAVEAMAGVKVIQSMQGSGNETFTVNNTNGGPADYITFTDGSVPDLAFSFRNGPVGQWRYANCGKTTATSSKNTSAGDAYELAINSGNNSGYLRIDLGSGDETSFGSSANSVDVMSFVVTTAKVGANYSVTFYDNDGTTLAAYTASGFAEGDELLFAHDDSMVNSGKSIGYAELYVTSGTITTTWSGAIDDFAFVSSGPKGGTLITIR